MMKISSWISNRRKERVNCNSRAQKLKPSFTSNSTSNNTGTYCGRNLTVTGDLNVAITNNGTLPIQAGAPLLTPFSVISPSRHFTGRQDLLQKMDDLISQLNTDSDNWEDKIGVIYGLGGVGKTELVRAYVSGRYISNDLKHVLVINGTNYQTAKKCFQDLAVFLFGSTVENYSKTRVIVPKIYDYFASKSDDVTLFIFENVTQLQGEDVGILKFLPNKLMGREYRIPLVLLISRHDDWNDILKPNQLCVSRLDKGEAEAYLLSRLKQLHVNKPMLENQEDPIGTLADILRGYPLGLTIAISNILNDIFNDTIFDKIQYYLDQKEKNHEEWLMQTLSGTATTDYKLTMDTVFNADIERIHSIEKDGQKAIHLLHSVSALCSKQLEFNREEAIRKLFLELNLQPVSQALRALFNYSIFVKPKGLSCQIHEIIELCESKWSGDYLRSKLEIIP